MEGRCGSCAHWVPPERREKYGHCGVAVNSGDIGDDKSQLCPDHQESRWEWDECDECVSLIGPLVASDASDYHAWIRCAEDFGCVLWSPKE